MLFNVIMTQYFASGSYASDLYKTIIIISLGTSKFQSNSTAQNRKNKLVLEHITILLRNDKLGGKTVSLAETHYNYLL